MRVLLLGANGFLGPHVAAALAPRHQLRITDIRPPADEIKEKFARHEFLTVDVTRAEQVLSEAKGMDAVINLAVVRPSRVLAFHVNMLGCFHVMQAAAAHGIRRVIGTGPHLSVVGPDYETLDHAIGPDAPPHPGTQLYALTKWLGLEVCRAFTRARDVYVQQYLFYDFRDPDELLPGQGGVPFLLTWADAAEVFRLGLEIDLAKLPSKCEVFFLFADAPQGKFVNEKAKRILGFAPKDDVSILWHKDQ
jgi:hypothetical protein